MTNKQLKNLKDTLWTTADQLRANSGLKSTEYAEPILGLISVIVHKWSFSFNSIPERIGKDQYHYNQYY